jgi:hypothetical protein
MQILDRHGHVCEQCRTPEQREIDISEEKKAAYKAEYDKQLAEFNWRKANFTREQWIESLLDGTYARSESEPDPAVANLAGGAVSNSAVSRFVVKAATADNTKRP